MMKKVLVMCLMSAMCLSQTFAQNQVKSIPAQATETRASAFSGGTGTEEDPFLISTPQDLVQLSNDVNAKVGYKGQYLKMTCDIDMSEVGNFRPIGNNNSGVLSFEGVFDGDNHTITNLNCDYARTPENQKSSMGIALFGVINNAEVKNLKIDDSNFIGQYFVSAISAVCIGGKIKNCHVGKNVDITAEFMGAAGITAGAMLTGTLIEDCSSAATVTAHVIRNGEGAVAGGILASVSEGADGTIIRRCVNYGNIISDYDFAAGILPMIEFKSTVEDCANFGKITSGRGGSGIAYFGIKKDKDHLVVLNNYNVGEIIGTDPEYVDAVCLGNLWSNPNTGEVFINTRLENNFFAEDTNGAVSKTAEAMQSADMKTQEFVDKLNNGRENGPWCIIEGVADGFPVPFANLIPTSIKDVEVSTASISYNAGVVTVAGAKAGDKFAVVDMAGRTVKMAEAQNGEFTIDLSNVPAGVYVIGNGSVSKKIVK